MGPGAPSRRRNRPTWLARMVSREEWNAPPSGSVTEASPYQLRSSTVPSAPSSSSERRSPASVALVCTTRSQPSGASAGAAKPTPRAGRDLGPGGVDVDEGDLDAGDAGQQPRDAAAHHAGADDRDPVADQRGGVPQRVHGGLDGAGEHRPLRGYAVGNRDDGGRRDDVRRLMGVEAEHGATGQIRRAVLDAPRR